MMKSYFERFINKKLLILGFGKEGQSTYTFIRKHFPDMPLAVADLKTEIPEGVWQSDTNVTFLLGDNYLSLIHTFDVVFKTPGISIKDIEVNPDCIYSQTQIFLELYKEQAIGITGTKGKSTTSSLLYHIIKQQTDNVMLTGNIGTPAFDIIDEITPDTVIVYELSSHQLEHVKHSPHIAILLNIFEEHLDHYVSYKHYQLAKMNIATFQNVHDYLIYNHDEPLLNELVDNLNNGYKIPIGMAANSDNMATVINNNLRFTIQRKQYDIELIENPLHGKHNLYNILAASVAAKLAGVEDKAIQKGLQSFKPLEHRLEYAGCFKNVHFYNDSIATIPEAAMAAVKALDNVSTIILGGYDRGINYASLALFLKDSKIENVILLAQAGKRIYSELEKVQFKGRFEVVADMEKAVLMAYKYTPAGKACLLSPAAASYGAYQDFKERGNAYKSLIHKYAHQTHK